MSPSYNPDEIMDAVQRADYGLVLEKAMPHALAGNPDAQCTIALMYECGLGIQRDFLEAERWLLRATQQNSALACIISGPFMQRSIQVLRTVGVKLEGVGKRPQRSVLTAANRILHSRS